MQGPPEKVTSKILEGTHTGTIRRLQSLSKFSSWNKVAQTSRRQQTGMTKAMKETLTDHEVRMDEITTRYMATAPLATNNFTQKNTKGNKCALAAATAFSTDLVVMYHQETHAAIATCQLIRSIHASMLREGLCKKPIDSIEGNTQANPEYDPYIDKCNGVLNETYYVSKQNDNQCLIAQFLYNQTLTQGNKASNGVASTSTNQLVWFLELEKCDRHLMYMLAIRDNKDSWNCTKCINAVYPVSQFQSLHKEAVKQMSRYLQRREYKGMKFEFQYFQFYLRTDCFGKMEKHNAIHGDPATACFRVWHTTNCTLLWEESKLLHTDILISFIEAKYMAMSQVKQMLSYVILKLQESKFMWFSIKPASLVFHCEEVKDSSGASELTGIPKGRPRKSQSIVECNHSQKHRAHGLLTVLTTYTLNQQADALTNFLKKEVILQADHEMLNPLQLREGVWEYTVYGSGSGSRSKTQSQRATSSRTNVGKIPIKTNQAWARSPSESIKVIESRKRETKNKKTSI